MNIRVTPEVRSRFHAAARVRGTRASNVLHQFMVAFAKQVEKEDPEDFARKLLQVIAEEQGAEKPVIDAAIYTEFDPPGDAMVLAEFVAKK